MPKLPKYCSRNKNQLGNKYVRFSKGTFSTYLTDKPWSEEFMRQYADALKGIKRKRRRIVDNFWTYVNKRAPTECWPWTKQIDKQGYGRAQAKDDVLAHRHAWKLTNGPIPKGFHVLHHCDNPACCNPSHLFLGTHQDNMKDRNKKRRFHSILNNREVRTIRRLRQSGIGPTEIGKQFGISQSHVSHICAGDIWKT